MAKVRIDPVKSSVESLLPSSTPSAKRTLKTGTISVTPTVISPAKSNRTAVLAAAITGAGKVTSEFFKTKANIDFKREQLELQQAQMAKESQARSNLLNIVNNTISEVQGQTGNPFDFDEGEARASVRSNVLRFMSGEQGALVSNDTLRLALSTGDSIIEELIPKTTIKLDAGIITTIQELDGDVEVDHIVVDKEQALLNSWGTFLNTHPTMAQNLINRDDLTDPQKTEQAEVFVALIASVEEAKIMSDVAKARNPVSEKPEAVRRALAQQDFFTMLKGQSRVAMGALATDFDGSVPGAYINLADEYIADMNDIILTDRSAGKLSQQYEVDVFSLVESQTAKFITAQANWLRSLDVLNVKKQGTEASVAEATRLSSELKIEDTIFKGNLPPSLRFMAIAGSNLAMAPSYEKMIKRTGAKTPAFNHMVTAMGLANTRFQQIGQRILDVEDMDDENAKSETQNIMKDFFVDATNWANRDIIESLDIRGFVTSMEAMRQSGTFKRIWPDQFLMLEEIYENAKSIPENTALFLKLEKGEDINSLIMEAYREAAKAEVLEGLE